MKIVLIAGLSSKHVREHLELRKESRFYKIIIKLLGLPPRVGIFSDKALWVNSIINDFKERPNIELHVVAPHIRLKKSYQRFEIDGVFYHYFPAELTSILRLLKSYRLWKMLQQSKRHARRILKEIQPDIVILSGAENPVTSGSVFGAVDYPCLCLCQTVYNNPDMDKYIKPNILRQKLELDIFNELEYFGVYCKRHYDLLKANSKDKLIFRFDYPPSKSLPQPLKIRKEYDFINFAQVHSIAKGTPDSVKALAIVKRQFPNVTLNIVGNCDGKIRAELDEIIHKNGLEKNIVFTPFFERKGDLFIHIQKSRFGILPCKLDNTSGTMSQCMVRGIPIIVYRTSGTPAFNKVRQCALIADMDNVEGLAQHMIKLLSDSKLVETLRVNGRWYKENQMQQRIDNWNKMADSLSFIIEHYRHGTPIPLVRLYKPEDD